MLCFFKLTHRGCVNSVVIKLYLQEQPVDYGLPIPALGELNVRIFFACIYLFFRFEYVSFSPLEFEIHEASNIID